MFPGTWFQDIPCDSTSWCNNFLPLSEAIKEFEKENPDNISFKTFKTLHNSEINLQNPLGPPFNQGPQYVFNYEIDNKIKRVFISARLLLNNL